VQDPYLNSVLEAIAADERDGDGPRLITVDELRAAGALDVPASWRKSLGTDDDRSRAGGTLPLFDDLACNVADETAATEGTVCHARSQP